jgi:hypothetical protein
MMDVIRIETLLVDDTLYLPQLKPLVGKSVEITVREKAVPVIAPGIGSWDDVKAAVLGLGDYDADAWRETRSAEDERATPGDP